MTSFQIVGDNLTGHGLSFEIAAFVGPLEEADLEEAERAEVRKRVLAAIVDFAEDVYRAGRVAVLPAYDDRYDLSNAVETLRALSVIVGPINGERHRRAADVIACLLQDASEDGA